MFLSVWLCTSRKECRNKSSYFPAVVVWFKWKTVYPVIMTMYRYRLLAIIFKTTYLMKSNSEDATHFHWSSRGNCSVLLSGSLQGIININYTVSFCTMRQKADSLTLTAHYFKKNWKVHYSSSNYIQGKITDTSSDRVQKK